jgi:perosamine synthetase
MASTSFVVLQQNAIPVFADVDPKTFQIDPESVRKLITSRTKAIITVALYGLSPDMDPIMEMAREHGIVVIEDDAQSFLSKYKGRMVGTIGDMASFSFQRTKHMTAGEGGMVITNNESYADAIRQFAGLGYVQFSGKNVTFNRRDIMNPNVDRHASLGWNYRMPELCGAVALAQIERLDELVAQRVEIANAYSGVVSKCSWLVPQRIPDDCTSSYWSYVVRLDRDDITWERLFDTYEKHGGDGFYAAWKLTYMEPMFQNMNLGGRERFFEPPLYEGERQIYEPGLCPVAERLQPKLVQFKGGYTDPDRFARQMEALEKTIDELS